MDLRSTLYPGVLAVSSFGAADGVGHCCHVGLSWYLGQDLNFVGGAKAYQEGSGNTGVPKSVDLDLLKTEFIGASQLSI
jgi:hypothetical protein